MNFVLLKKIALWTIAVGVVFSSGYYLGVSGFRIEKGNFASVKISRDLPQNRIDIDFREFWKIWDILENSYYDKSKLVPYKMVYGAISGMVSAVGDPYTSFLTPDENKVVEEDLSGTFQGVGIQIGFKGKNLAVVAPLPNSPAEEAGIKAGDFIIGIIDQEKKVETGTVGMNLNDAVKLIRGRAGSKVTLVLTRDGSDTSFKKEIVRKELDVPSVVTKFLENDSVAHVRLLKFGADTDKEWQKAVAEVTAKSNLKGIVLDLRNNPGGYLQAAVDIASEFVKKDSVVVIEDRGGSNRNEYKTTRSGKFGDMKVVILINGGSASASEILSGALSETKGYKLIGDTSFGKGTVQEPMQLDKGSSLHITIAKWLTPKGNWVHEKGIEPDIKVLDNDDTDVDEQLEVAIKEFLMK